MEATKLLLCPSCKKDFTTKDSSRSQQHIHFPYILQCGHTVCETCLRNARKAKQKFTCVICQVDTDLPEEDFTQFVTPDIYILGQLTFALRQKLSVKLKLISIGASQKNKRERSSDVLCDECNKASAVWRCDKCAVNFCNNCFDMIHKRSKVMKKHESHPIHSEEYHSMVQGGCSEHSERQIEFFCETDKELVCSLCAVRGRHKGHDIVTLVEKNESYIDELKIAIEEAQKIQQRFKYTEKKLQQALPSSKVDVSHLVGEVKKHFHKIHSILQLRESHLLSQLQDISNHNITSIENMCDGLSHYRKEMTSVLKDAEELLANRYVSVSAIELIKKLQFLKDVPCYLVSADTTENPEIKITFDQDRIEKLKEYGDVEAEPKPKYALKNLKELPSDYPMEMEEDVTTDTESATSYSGQSDSQSEDLSPSPVPGSLLSKEKNAFLKPNIGTMKEEIFVSHICSPSNFWVQKASDKRKLENMQDAINKWCNSTSDDRSAAKSAQIGTLYLVRYSGDGKWYRARLKKIISPAAGDSEPNALNATAGHSHSKEDLVEMLYVDYGNSEIIPVSRLKSLPPRYLHQSVFATNCSLWDIVPAKDDKWSQEAIRVFAKFVGIRPVLMKIIMERSDMLYVDLCQKPDNDIINDVPVSVRDALVFLDYGSLVSETRELGFKQKMSRKYLPAEQLCLDVVVNVILSHVNSPDNFYVQKLGGGARYLSNLQFQLQEQYDKEPEHLRTIYTPSVGMVCVGQYSRDKQWYRAEIISVKNSNMVEVQYIDYGNVEFVPYWRLRKIPDVYLKLNKQAICCSLADVTPVGDNGWTDEISQWFTEAAGKKQLQVRTKSIIPGQKKASVVLYDVDAQICINGLMVKEAFAVSTGPESTILEVQREKSPKPRTIPNVVFCQRNDDIPCEKLPSTPAAASVTTAPSVPKKNALPYLPVHVVYAESPSCINVRLASDEEHKKFEKLVKDMQEVYQQTEISDVQWKVKDICAVLSSDDSRWYRGIISMEAEEDNFQVKKIDFGSCEVVHKNDLRVLLDPFQEEHIFSIKCRLDGIIPAGASNQWSFMACEFLQELITKHEIFFMANKGEMDGEFQPVDLMYEEIQGGALEPSTLQYKSISRLLLDKGLALPTRRLSQEKNPSESKENVPRPSPSAKDNIDAVPKEKNLDVNDEKKIVNGGLHARDVKTVKSQNKILHWKPPSQPDDESFIVLPTHVGNDCCIYFNLASSKPVLNLINTALHEKYSSSEVKPPDTMPVVGQACIAQFCLDKRWYRAQIVSRKADQVKVLFIDYGNVEVLHLDEIRTDLILTDIPQQCLEGELFDLLPVSEDGEWPSSVLNFIHSTIVDQACYIKLKEPCHPGKRLQLSLTLPNETSLSSLLIENGYAISTSSLIDSKQEVDSVKNEDKEELPEMKLPDEIKPKIDWADLVDSFQEDTTSIMQSFASPTLPKAGTQFPLLITQFLEPNLVYIQQLLFRNATIPEAEERNEEYHQFVAMMEELDENAKNFDPLNEPRPGMACCGKYTYDNKWYRCQIKAVNKDEISVLYVDYGNSEKVALERLRRLPDKFLKFPIQAQLCKLYGISPAGSIWQDEEVNSVFTELFHKNYSFLAEVRKFGIPLEIELFIDGSCTEGGSPQPITQVIEYKKENLSSQDSS